MMWMKQNKAKTCAFYMTEKGAYNFLNWRNGQIDARNVMRHAWNILWLA